MNIQNYIAKRFQHAGSGLSLDTEALSKYSDIIDLSIGDTDFTTDEAIIEKAYLDAKAGHTHYGDPKGDPELIAAVCKAWQEDFSQALTPDHVLVTASSCLGMALTMLAILNPGDEVIVFSPYFAMYRSQIELAGGVCVDVPTYACENYAISEERLRAAITPKTKAIIFNNPTNPTGMAYGRETLELLAKIAQEYDLLVAADEIYTTYLYEGDYIPLRTLPGMLERTITLNSFSKNFLMTGWRVGVIIAEPAVRHESGQRRADLLCSVHLPESGNCGAGKPGAHPRALHCRLPRAYFLFDRAAGKAPVFEPCRAEGHVLSVPGRGENRAFVRRVLQGAAGAGAHPRLARRRVRHCGQAALPHRMHREYRQAPRGV